MSIRILVGDVRERLAALPDGSVQCVVTSPPYFGLRDYGTASWDGGDPACDHRQGRPGAGRADGIVDERSQRNRDGVGAYGRHCRKCGAVRVDNQIGLEPTLAEYIDTLVEVFRDVRRVLHPTGTCWLNLGDSYAASGGVANKGSYDGGVGRHYNNIPRSAKMKDGLKPKDLMMVPARVAIALQDDGWYLRSDIIWAKKNCMPESVTDRPTSSHEHIFLMAKRAKYFYDAEAVREEHAPHTFVKNGINPETGKGYPVNNRSITPADYGVHEVDKLWGNMAPGAKRSMNPAGRNQRNVWHLATEPFPDAHFATFPTEIPRRCIAAGTSEKGQCAACGAPWVRQIEKSYRHHENWFGTKQDARHSRGAAGNGYNEPIGTTTTGWRPSCSCDADVVPQTVLDPFLGSGTTLLVADRLGRNGIGVELSPTYAEMARQRIYGDAPMFADVAAD